MIVVINDKAYESKPVKARMFRKAIELTELFDLENLKSKDLDAMIDFFVESYDFQFTRDEVYDGLESTKLMPALTERITEIVGSVKNKLESKNV
jgi:hypothetical protein